MENDFYRKGIAAAESGNLQKAYQLFAQILKENPSSEKAWIALGRYLEDKDKKRGCFEKVLSINPHNQTAKNLLESLNKPAEPEESFFTEEELSGEWNEREEDQEESWTEESIPDEWKDEEEFPEEESWYQWEEEEKEEFEDEWGSQEVLPEEWQTEAPLPGEEPEEEIFDDEWGIQESLPDEWQTEESLLSEEPDEEKFNDEWESESTFPEERIEEPFFTEDEETKLPDHWGSDEEDYNEWEEESPWIQKDTSSEDVLERRWEGIRSEDRIKDTKSPKANELSDIWGAAEDTFADSTPDKKKKRSSQKGSWVGKIITVFLSLIIMVLLITVAFLAIIDPTNPPEFIEPYLSQFIPLPTTTEPMPSETEGPIATVTPARLPPTWTPDPSSMSDSLEASPTPNLTPTSTFTTRQEIGDLVITTDDSGWSQYSYTKEKWAISIPPDWVYFNLEAEDFNEMLTEVASTNPYLAEIYTPNTLENMISGNIKFLAADNEISSLDVATHLQVTIDTLPSLTDLDNYSEERVQELQEVLGEDADISQERIEIGALTASELIYETTVDDMFGDPVEVYQTEYIVLQRAKRYMLAFTTPKNLFNQKYPLFIEIAQSFKILD